VGDFAVHWVGLPTRNRGLMTSPPRYEG
jgi:hypothetical protein